MQRTRHKRHFRQIFVASDIYGCFNGYFCLPNLTWIHFIFKLTWAISGLLILLWYYICYYVKRSFCGRILVFVFRYNAIGSRAPLRYNMKLLTRTGWYSYQCASCVHFVHVFMCWYIPWYGKGMLLQPPFSTRMRLGVARSRRQC